MFRSRLNVFLKVLALGKVSRTLEYNIDSQVFPRQASRVFFHEEFNFFAIDRQLIGFAGNCFIVPAIDGIVFEQVGDVVNQHDIVHCDQFKFGGGKGNL